MNFISENIENLSSGGRIYVIFQLIYLLVGVFFFYVQVRILRELKKARKMRYNNRHEDYSCCHHSRKSSYGHRNNNMQRGGAKL